MSLSSSPPRRQVEPLGWDTTQFGFGVGELTGDPVAGDFASDTVDDVEAALHVARQSGTQLVYLKSHGIAPDALARLTAAASVDSIYADGRAVFAKSITTRAEPGASEAPRVLPYPVELPSPELVALALQAGEHSRFRQDPRFPQAAFVRLYSEWVRRSTLREVCSEVLVARTSHSPNSPAGFVTVTATSEAASVGLIAVSANARNLGIGAALLSGAEHVAHTAGCRQIRVVTQQSNQAACGLYRKSGYYLVQQSFVYHLWLKPC